LPPSPCSLVLCSFPAPASTETHTLSLHDALPISAGNIATSRIERLHLYRPAHSDRLDRRRAYGSRRSDEHGVAAGSRAGVVVHRDRKSTRLNSSHVKISYAVFCLKKKTKKHNDTM